MSELDKILATEFCLEFVEKMKRAMTASFYKYGPVKENYPQNVDAVESLKKRLKQYAETGNTEYLIDVANFAMIEFMYPKHEKAFYQATDSDKSPGLVGLSVGEAKRFQELEG